MTRPFVSGDCFGLPGFDGLALFPATNDLAQAQDSLPRRRCGLLHPVQRSNVSRSKKRRPANQAFVNAGTGNTLAVSAHQYIARALEKDLKEDPHDNCREAIGDGSVLVPGVQLEKTSLEYQEYQDHERDTYYDASHSTACKSDRRVQDTDLSEFLGQLTPRDHLKTLTHFSADFVGSTVVSPKGFAQSPEVVAEKTPQQPEYLVVTEILDTNVGHELRWRRIIEDCTKKGSKQNKRPSQTRDEKSPNFVLFVIWQGVEGKHQSTKSQRQICQSLKNCTNNEQHLQIFLFRSVIFFFGAR